MAFITTSGNQCYACGKQCINVEFCNDGGSYDFSVSYPRNIKVTVRANPDFWGFSGVLISGYATFHNGYYDFFDGFDEDYSILKVCGQSIIGFVNNEARPDVMYRSVYDPDTGVVTHYGSDGTTVEGTGIGRGGAEVYLIDRGPGRIGPVESSDQMDCGYTIPTKIFKYVPDNFGWGNKIHFTNKIYKNLTGAWRLVDIDQCVPSGMYVDEVPGKLLECDGTERQNIATKYKNKQYQEFEPTRYQHMGPNQFPCHGDGGVPSPYGGSFTYESSYPGSIYRSDPSGQIEAIINYYDPTQGYTKAEYLYVGDEIVFKGLPYGSLNRSYRVSKVEHLSDKTKITLAGTQNLEPTGIFTLNLSDVYQSGEWYIPNTFDELTCCSHAAYNIKNKRFYDSNYHLDFRRVYNNPKNIRQSNRNIEDRYTYDMFDGLSSNGSGNPRKDYTYPYKDEQGNITYPRELPYYGPFFEVDKLDDAKRGDQKPYRGIHKNPTCYSKRATLEIFPDCLVQWDSYTECGNPSSTKYIINKVPRLAFVYRGCNYNDPCFYDAQGRPLGGWQNGQPQNIDDLKRLLAGQEIYMFINLGTAWGGRLPNEPCPCDCQGLIQGDNPPQHLEIPSVMTYPKFPNFDLDPVKWGCLNEYHQMSKYYEYEHDDFNNPPTGVCMSRPTSAPACWPRQPYTTYGYMMNLCGKNTRNPKNVIKNGFSSYPLTKEYTNENYTVDIDEPMFWSCETPDPAPVYGNGLWSSGTQPCSDGGCGTFEQSGGAKYGWWGLADINGVIAAPYFPTKESEKPPCCGGQSTTKYLDFSKSGVYFNDLGTINGWQTTGVPFLIEIEFDDICLGCVTANTEPTPLNISFNGLPAEFIWNDNNKYGFNYCAYLSSDEHNYKLKIDFPPQYTCASGWDEKFCTSGDAQNIETLFRDYGYPYTGNTCPCVDGFEIKLEPHVIPSSNIVLGWSVNPKYMKDLPIISGCSDNESQVFTSYGGSLWDGMSPASGYIVRGYFSLACEGMHGFLWPIDDTEILNAFYSQGHYSPLDILYNSDGCGHRYPVNMSKDLKLETHLYLHSAYDWAKLWAENLPLSKLRPSNNICNSSSFDFMQEMGLCPGDKVYTYGCKLPSGNFYGCPFNGSTLYGGGDQCKDTHICNTCSGVTCCQDIDDNYWILDYKGNKPPNPRIPLEFQFNECACLCSEPTLIAEYEVAPDGTGLILISGDYADCADVYWMSASGLDGREIPILPLNIYDAVNNNCLLYSTSQSYDYFEWEHSVNGVVSGIKYELEEIINNCGMAGQSTGKILYDCSDADCGAFPKSNVGSCTNQPIYMPDPGTTIQVRRKKCHPEVAIVDKIECVTSGVYKLHISREYHNHDRTWRMSDGQGGCKPAAAGAYKHNGGNCHIMYYAQLTDSVTPVYNNLCSVHPSSGTYVSQDFQLIQPFSDGDYVWNYFNLFYSKDHLPTVSNGTLDPTIGKNPDDEFSCAYDDPSPGYAETMFPTGEYANYKGIFYTNKQHSCVQDITECGGDLWCNKLFFPRHYYKAGTKCMAFAASTLCTQSAEFLAPPYKGYEDGDSYLLEEMLAKYVDPCHPDSTVTILYDVDIDDDVIFVDDYIPLILGGKKPKWYSTVNMKSCVIANQGCMDTPPTHTDYSIKVGLHAPRNYTTSRFNSMGYYLDAYGDGPLMRPVAESDNCLFNKFKILINVECNTNRIKRSGIPIDPPTILHGVQYWPGPGCKGNMKWPGCTCDDTPCVTFYESENNARCEKFIGVYAIYNTGEPVQWFCPSGTPTCATDGSMGLSNCQSGEFGPTVDLMYPSNAPNIAYVHESLLDPIICYENTGEITCTEGSGTNSITHTYATASGLYYRGPSGFVYTTGGPYWFHVWDCSGYQYRGPEHGYDGECLCAADHYAGLCSAIDRCYDYRTWDCQIVDNQQTSAEFPSGWWYEDCGCHNKTTTLYTHGWCQNNSVVKFVITEDES